MSSVDREDIGTKFGNLRADVGNTRRVEKAGRRENDVLGCACWLHEKAVHG